MQVKKSEEVKKLIENIDKFCLNYYQQCNFPANKYVEEGVNKEKEKKVQAIYNFNFFKEVKVFKSYNGEETNLKLNIDQLILNVKFNIYNLDQKLIE